MMKATTLLAFLALILHSAVAQFDELGVYSNTDSDCAIVLNLRETSFFAYTAPQNSDCEDFGVYLGPITFTSAASGSNADAAIIITFVEVPYHDQDRVPPGSTVIADLYTSGSRITLRNQDLEDLEFWPPGGLKMKSSEEFAINGIYDGNDTSITYANNELYMRIGGFEDDITKHADYVGASVGAIRETDTKNVFEILPVVETNFEDNDNDDTFEPLITPFVQTSTGWVVQLPGMPDLEIDERDEDDLTGVWYGRDPSGGDDCIQSTEFLNGIFFAYRFGCEDGLAAGGNLTVSAYIGRYNILPNDQLQLLYAYAAPDEDGDFAGYEATFDLKIKDDQIKISGYFSEDSNYITITLNRADEPTPSMVVDITVDADIDTFNVENFLTGLAEALGIPRSTIDVLSVSSGSVVVEVAIRRDNSDPDAQELDEINDALEDIASGNTMIGGYNVEAVAQSRAPGGESGANTAVASLVASLGLVAMALFF